MMMSVADPVLPQYEWLVVVGSFGAFWFGFATGEQRVRVARRWFGGPPNQGYAQPKA